MDNQTVTIYIKAKKHTIVQSLKVKLGMVASVTCTDKQLLQQIEAMELYRFRPKGNKTNTNQAGHARNSRFDSASAHNAMGKIHNTANSRMEFFSILKIIEKIQTSFPWVEVVSIGEQDFVVEYQTGTTPSAWVNVLKVALLCIVIFFGSAFTIMAFNNDVSVTEVFERFYLQIMGQEKGAVSELEISYCVGLTVGILIFFNHIGRRKFSMDPTPIQIEVNKFASDMDDTIIEAADRRGHEEDVSQ